MTANAISPVTSAGKITIQIRRLTTVTVVALLARTIKAAFSTPGIIRRALASARRGGLPDLVAPAPGAPRRGLEQPHDAPQVFERARNVDDEEPRAHLEVGPHRVLREPDDRL